VAPSAATICGVNAVGKLAVAALVPASLAAAASGATARPAVDVIRTHPVTVAASGFRPTEHVLLTVRAGSDRKALRVVATARGTFRAAALTVAYDPCAETLRVTAVGAAGSRATEKLPQRACAPQP
jgi:hypothetical protein